MASKFQNVGHIKNVAVHFQIWLPFRKYIYCRGFDVKLAKIVNFHLFSRRLPKFNMAAISKNVPVHFHFRLSFRKYIYCRGLDAQWAKIANFPHFPRWLPKFNMAAISKMFQFTSIFDYLSENIYIVGV